MVVAAGGEVSISGTGTAFALGSAATYAVYLIVGRHLGRRSDAMTRSLLGGRGRFGQSPPQGSPHVVADRPRGDLGQLALYGIATALAFWLTFAALARIGTSRTAVVSTLEAFSAIVLAAVFLDENVTAAQTAGGAAILVAAGVIALTAHTSQRPPATAYGLVGEGGSWLAAEESSS